MSCAKLRCRQTPVLVLSTGNCNGFNVCLASERLPVLRINAIMFDKSQSWIREVFRAALRGEWIDVVSPR